MSETHVSPGVVHEVPADLRRVLVSDTAALAKWEDITPLARNEWICWVESVKKAETRAHHIERARDELKAGKRRPCCWPGVRIGCGAAGDLWASRASLHPLVPAKAGIQME